MSILEEVMDTVRAIKREGTDPSAGDVMFWRDALIGEDAAEMTFYYRGVLERLAEQGRLLRISTIPARFMVVAE